MIWGKKLCSYAVPALFSLFLLTACGTFEVGIERMPTAQATSAATASPTARPRPSPTPPSPTPLPPSPTPTATPFAPQALPPTQVWPSNTTRLMPAPLYYLSDERGSWQIWRLETDGSHSTALTNSPQPIERYDVSPATGRLAYISNQQLFITDALGHDPQPIDTPNEELSKYPTLAWAPDGTRLFFTGQSGLWIYTVAGRTTVRWLALPKDASVLTIAKPQPWSPDGRILLINTLSADWGEVNYLPVDETPSLTQIGLSICDEVRWSLDSHTLYGSRETLYGPCDNPGLSRWDLGGHAVTPLIMSESITPTQHVLAHFVRAAQEGPDGLLYYFYGSADLPYSDTAGTLFMVRSAPDGVTDQHVLRSESYRNLGEVLWASDMSAAVIVQGSAGYDERCPRDGPVKGAIKLLPTDNKPALFIGSHPTFAVAGWGCQLHWGQAE